MNKNIHKKFLNRFVSDILSENYNSANKALYNVIKYKIKQKIASASKNKLF